MHVIEASSLEFKAHSFAELTCIENAFYDAFLMCLTQTIRVFTPGLQGDRLHRACIMLMNAVHGSMSFLPLPDVWDVMRRECLSFL